MRVPNALDALQKVLYGQSILFGYLLPAPAAPSLIEMKLSSCWNGSEEALAL